MPVLDLPTVTVVTPSYNQAQFLEETILSVLSQDYPKIEYIIIDGGSTDGSVEIIRRYQDRLAFWASEVDRGQSHAINKGLQRASGGILAWLNSDDVYCPGAVRAAVDYFKSQPDVTLLYGRVELIYSDGTVALPFPWEDFDVQACVVHHSNPIPQPAAFFRRDAVQRVGLLDERLHYSMDWDYWIRIALAGLKVSKIPHTLARMRLHSASKTVKGLIEREEQMVAWVNSFFSQPLPPEIAALERRSHSMALLGLARQHFYHHHYASARQAVRKGIMQYPRILLKDWVFLLPIIAMLPGPAITLALHLKRVWFDSSPFFEARRSGSRRRASVGCHDLGGDA